MMKPLLVITGATSVGKTALSLELAEFYNGEIISCDSQQIYRYMDIGTAKPTKAEREKIPHHLIDFLEPEETFSVASFQKMATEIIMRLHQQGKLPLLVGGTGLYIKAVTEGYQFHQTAELQEIRKCLEEKTQSEGLDSIFKVLQEVDPESAKKIHPNDKKRIIRGLEVYYLTGTAISKWSKQNRPPDYQITKIGLTCQRDVLYERINRRVDLMLEQGLADEVKFLRENFREIHPAGLGYKEISSYLDGRMTFSEAVELFKRRTRQFAKRQLTWFRQDKDITWFDIMGGDLISKIKTFLAGESLFYAEVNRKN